MLIDMLIWVFIKEIGGLVQIVITGITIKEVMVIQIVLQLKCLKSNILLHMMEMVVHIMVQKHGLKKLYIMHNIKLGKISLTDLVLHL